MKIIGLTSGTCGGASTVAKILKQKGFAIIEADKIAREIMQPDSVAWHKLIRAFGEEIINDNWEIDRTKLGILVFSNKKFLTKLNQITHPGILERMKALAKAFEKKGVKIVFFDAPLLIETGLNKDIDFLIVVNARLENRVKRIMARDSLSRGEALKRINAQIPLEQKIKLADFVIENNGSLSELKKQVACLEKGLQKKFKVKK